MDDALNFTCLKCGEQTLCCELLVTKRYEALFTDDGDIDLSELPDQCDTDKDEEEAIWYCGNCGEEVLRGSKSDIIEHLEEQALTK